MKFFFFILISMSIYADNVKVGAPDTLHPYIEHALKKKTWRAASDKMVVHSHCKREIPSLSTMAEYLKSIREDNSGGTISKLHLPEEDKNLIEHFKEMVVSKHNALDLTRHAHCKDVICLSTNVFGEKRGIKFLYMKVKYGLNPSHHVYKDARPWKPNEVDPYLKAVLAHPTHLRKLNRNKAFIHDSSSEGDTLANSYLRIFGAADDLSDESKEYTAFHELGHYISGELNIDRSKDWLDLSDWKVNSVREREIKQVMNKEEEAFSMPDFSIDLSRGLNNTFGFQKVEFLEEESLMQKIDKQLMEMQIHYTAMDTESPNKIVSEYGQVNPAEDFAESMAAYRYNPLALLKANPEKYDFLKDKVFRGVEYLNSNHCTK